ncbi:NAD/NADP octopine/nopaline dehydrogenase family protein [Providencia rettgeri]|uniref:NAD/NADP octopine/nopaline dehydrogenase family protein n=1 Tax=Providencia rettgeri TaxID=587 RepID=UPI0018C5C922|nr:NAD/NADP octopine/nopaline dehydrogenase family protein [Providencia rettgeri]MBG5927032.1 NAD/NADP octopine/nopaline dehydrogenase family protein [Providencia rettgeri]
MSEEKHLNVVICGGGQTGHLAVALFSQYLNIKTSLLTQNATTVERHQQQNNILSVHYNNGEIINHSVGLITNSPQLVIPEADIVILTVPSHHQASWLRFISAYLSSSKTVFIGAIPGINGFDWLAEQFFKNNPNIVIWGMKDVPHIAWGLEPGTKVCFGGEKSALFIAFHRRENESNKKQLHKLLSRLYSAPISILDNYLEITLTPANPIMHSSVIYGLIGPYAQWHNDYFESPICWWNDCTELSAYYLQRCDEERLSICRHLIDNLGIPLVTVKSLIDELREVYPKQISNTKTLWSILRTNEAYHGIQLPLIKHKQSGWSFNKQHRVFQEDIVYGLSLLVHLGEHLNIPLPYTNEIYTWCMGSLTFRILPSAS